MCSQITSCAVSVKSDEDLRRVANISVNNEAQLAELIVEAIQAVGDHGTVHGR